MKLEHSMPRRCNTSFFVFLIDESTYIVIIMPLYITQLFWDFYLHNIYSFCWCFKNLSTYPVCIQYSFNWNQMYNYFSCNIYFICISFLLQWKQANFCSYGYFIFVYTQTKIWEFSLKICDNILSLCYFLFFIANVSWIQQLPKILYLQSFWI